MMEPQVRKEAWAYVRTYFPEMWTHLERLERENEELRAEVKRLKSYERSWVADHYGEDTV